MVTVLTPAEKAKLTRLYNSQYKSDFLPAWKVCKKLPAKERKGTFCDVEKLGSRQAFANSVKAQGIEKTLEYVSQKINNMTIKDLVEAHEKIQKKRSDDAKAKFDNFCKDVNNKDNKKCVNYKNGVRMSDDEIKKRMKALRDAKKSK